MTARVKARGVRDLTSAQFTVAWDPAVLKYEGRAGTGSGNERREFGGTSTARGKLVFSWDDPGAAGVTLADGVTVFTVHLPPSAAPGILPALALVDELAGCEAGVNFEAAPFRARNALVILRSSPLVSAWRCWGRQLIGRKLGASGSDFSLRPGTLCVALRPVPAASTPLLLRGGEGWGEEAFKK